MFGAFVFLQFTVLGLANHAGEGYLATAQRDLVYYALQVFVILGYLLHSLFFRYCAGKRARGVMAGAVLGLFFAGMILLCALGHDSLLYRLGTRPFWHHDPQRIRYHQRDRQPDLYGRNKFR